MVVTDVHWLTVYERQLAELPLMVQGVQSSDPTTQLEAVTKFRKLLSIGRELFHLYPHPREWVACMRVFFLFF